MSIFRCHPSGEGKHQNVHFLAKHKKKIITFRIVGFLNSGEAYILNHKTKLNYDLIDLNLMYTELSAAMLKYDFILKTPQEKLLKNNLNTEGIINNFNLNNI